MDVGEIMLSVNRCFPEVEMIGNWEIAGGKVLPGVLPAGRYVAVAEDCAARGIYLTDSNGNLPADAEDCKFYGRIVVLAPPREFLSLCGEIMDWCREHGSGGVAREAFGSYSAAYRDNDGDWQTAFRQRLNRWRRMYCDAGGDWLC